MAIGAGDTQEVFGTQDVINATGSTSTVSDGNMSVAGDVASWTNDDDAKRAAVSLQWQYPSGTISAGGGFALYARKLNIDGTDDEGIPDATNKKHLIGFAQVDEGLATTTNDFISIDVPLKNTYTAQVYEFFWENLTGVTMSAGWEAKITPKADGVN